MDIKIVRTDFVSTGIFGELDPADESFSLFTLEHAYPVQADGLHSSTVFAPKIPSGVYICVRGTHTLKPTKIFPNPKPFQTFEVTNVPGHTEILIHPGNTEGDSEGCILLGLARQENVEVLHSKDAFKMFMEKQVGVDQFNLTII